MTVYTIIWCRLFCSSAPLVLNFSATILMLCDEFSLPVFFPFPRNSERRSSLFSLLRHRDLCSICSWKQRKTGNVSLKKSLPIANDQTQVFFSSSLWFFFSFFFLNTVLDTVIWEYGDNTCSLEYLIGRIHRDDKGRTLCPEKAREPQDNCEMSYRPSIALSWFR